MDATPRILSLATRVPSGRWTQAEVCDAFAEHFPLYEDRRVQRIFQASGIDTRHFVLGRDEFDPAADADTLHAVFEKGALELGTGAAAECLRAAELAPEDVDCIVATTCTGYVCPGLSARIAHALGMHDRVQRADLVGMGCAGAMPSLQRAHDFVRASRSAACWRCAWR